MRFHKFQYRDDESLQKSFCKKVYHPPKVGKNRQHLVWSLQTTLSLPPPTLLSFTYSLHSQYIKITQIIFALKATSLQLYAISWTISSWVEMVVGEVLQEEVVGGVPGARRAEEADWTILFILEFGRLDVNSAFWAQQVNFYFDGLAENFIRK